MCAGCDVWTDACVGFYRRERNSRAQRKPDSGVNSATLTSWSSQIAGTTQTGSFVLTVIGAVGSGSAQVTGALSTVMFQHP
jgi:hypothetical protein